MSSVDAAAAGVATATATTGTVQAAAVSARRESPRDADDPEDAEEAAAEWWISVMVASRSAGAAPPGREGPARSSQRIGAECGPPLAPE
jgi:hypothetical protein